MNTFFLTILEEYDAIFITILVWCSRFPEILLALLEAFSQRLGRGRNKLVLKSSNGLVMAI